MARSCDHLTIGPNSYTAGKKADPFWSSSAGQYWVRPEERPFLHVPLCGCLCGPLPQREPDSPRHITCVKCGKPVR